MVLRLAQLCGVPVLTARRHMLAAGEVCFESRSFQDPSAQTQGLYPKPELRFIMYRSPKNPGFGYLAP